MGIDEFNQRYIDMLAKQNGQDKDYVMNMLITMGIQACTETGKRHILENMETTDAN